MRGRWVEKQKKRKTLEGQQAEEEGGGKETEGRQ